MLSRVHLLDLGVRVETEGMGGFGLIPGRPVIVAENMIGCAMYELVRKPQTFVSARELKGGSRFELAMITW